jgi:adenylate cyclase
MTARILVVDDEPDLELLILQRFRRQIRDDEFSFIFADDGVNALAKLDADPDIDMLLCDINMPRMDGLTLLGRLQEREGHPATVIVSAYGDMANIRTAMNRGAFDFVTKPIDFADLETTIAKTLRNLEITRGYQRRQQEAERARAQLSRYFSPSLVSVLADDAAHINLDAQWRDITSMFTADEHHRRCTHCHVRRPNGPARSRRPCSRLCARVERICRGVPRTVARQGCGRWHHASWNQLRASIGRQLRWWPVF